MDFLILVIFVSGYTAIACEAQSKVNKAAVALLMAFSCWELIFIRKYPHVEQLISHLDNHLHEISQLFVFLLAAMVIVELMNAHGAFRMITNFIHTQSQRKLLWLITFITFFLSSVLDNLTTAIVMVSLIRGLVPDRDTRLIFASMVIVSANAGGAWSPIGDVTTTMMWIRQYITSANIIKSIFIPSLVSVLIPLMYFSFHVQRKVLAESAVLEIQKERAGMMGSRRIFFLGLAALIMVPVLRAVTGIPPFMGILVGLGVMWVFTDLLHQERHYLRVPHILTKIDISSILFFLGILLTIAALETQGILSKFATWMDIHLQDKDLIVTLMGLASAIIDNVPLTAAAMNMYDLSLYPTDSKIWEMIAYSVGTGGSILIIGSAAGVVVMGMEKISFVWYLRKVSLPVLIGFLCGIFSYLFIYPLLS